MKTIILLVLICCSSYSIFGQETDTVKTRSSKIKIKMKPQPGDYPGFNNNTNSTTIPTNNKPPVTTTDNPIVPTTDKPLVTSTDKLSDTTTDKLIITTTEKQSTTTTPKTSVTTIVIKTEVKTDPASLPVIVNDVPSNVVAAIKNKYGSNIYDIKKIKMISGDAYAVRILENGQLNTLFVSSDGNVINK